MSKRWLSRYVRPLNAALTVALLAVWGVFSITVHAQSAFVITGTIFGSPPVYQFGAMDIKTGAFRLIAVRKGYRDIYALGFGANGRLYGLSRKGMPQHPFVAEYRINPATGTMILEKKYDNATIFAASADRQGIFTGFDAPPGPQLNRLFTLDPVAQTLRLGTQTLKNPDGLVVADAQENIFAAHNTLRGFGNDVLTTFKQARRTPVSELSTNLLYARTGFFYKGSLYVFGADGNADVGIYTISVTSGAARYRTPPALPLYCFVQAAALIPDVLKNPPPAPLLNFRQGNSGRGL